MEPSKLAGLALAASLATAAMPAQAAEPLPRAEPAALGFSSARLGRIATTLEADIAAGKLPGAVVAVARRGRLAYFEAFGLQDPATRAPMPRDAIFPIASMTKPLTGVATMIMLEEAKLALTDPVGRFFPALGRNRVAIEGNPEQTEPALRPMTITDLLRHTSGLTYGGRGSTALHKLYPASSGTSSTQYDATSFIEKLGSLPLLNQPGSTWDYSLSIDVAGLVVEQISGQRLGGFLDQRVFQPLGMTDTGFVVPEAKRARYARALPKDPETGQPQGVTMGLTAPRFDCGGGCAVSTAADYLRFGQMLLNGGQLEGQRILSRKSVEEMTRDHLYPEIRNGITGTEPNMVNWGFGLSVAVRRPGGAGMLGSPGMYSWNGAYGTAFWVDPKEELVVVFMAAAPGVIRQYYRRVINALIYQAMED